MADLRPEIVGLNARNLSTMEMSLDRLISGRGNLPADTLHVAESGITSPAEFQAVAQAGYDAALIGSALVTASDPSKGVADMLAARSEATAQ